MIDDPKGESMLLLETVRSLLDEKLYPSAEIVAGFLLSRASVPSPRLAQRESYLHAEALSLLADALKGRGEHKRATMYYRQSQQHRKLGKDIALMGGGGANPALSSCAPHEDTTESGIGSSPGADRRRSEKAEGDQGVRRRKLGLTQWQKDDLPLADIKFKEAQCLLAAGELGAAISALEGIAQHARTAKASATLGRVYEMSGLKRNACNVYKQTLRQHPLAVETIVPLLEMGVSADKILSIVDAGLEDASNCYTSSSSSEKPNKLNRADLPWLTLYVKGHSASSACKPKEMLAHFARLEHMYPTNLGSVLQVAKAHMDLDQYEEAFIAFKKARLIDDMNVDCMDSYGVVMRKKNLSGGLNRLANELLSTDPKRAEAWLVMALYGDVMGDGERAVAFIDKALELKPNYVLAFIVKGSLLLAMRDEEAASKHFFQANLIRKDIKSYKGLVNSYLEAGKYAEASCAAKEATEVMPGDARTILLTGNVWEHNKSITDSKLKAKRAYEQALRLDPSLLDATLALVELELKDLAYDTCIQLLLQAIAHRSQDAVHSKLGEVYTLNRQYDDALESYHFALSLNPECYTASEGLERLEKLMRGVDPDDDEMDEGMDRVNTANASQGSSSADGGEYNAASPQF